MCRCYNFAYRLAQHKPIKLKIMMAMVASVFFHRFILQLRGVIISHGSIARIEMLLY